MRTFLRSASLVATLLLTACTAPSPTPPSPEAPKSAERISKTGEFLLTPYQRLANESPCTEAKQWPEAAFELQTIAPDTIEPGHQFTHTLIYSVCGKNLDQFVGGMLYRKIYLANRLVHSEPKPLDLKPGRWQLKALIEVPRGSRAGSYELRTEFVARGAKKGIQLRASGNFEVANVRPE